MSVPGRFHKGRDILMPTTRRQFAQLIAAGATSAAVLKAPSVAAQDRYTIATGGTGGVYYPYGGALASILSNDVADTDWSAEETSASVDNMYLIESGDADLAFVLADTAFDAGQGNDPFEAAVEASTIVTLYNNFTHLVVNGDAGITTVEDLAGKKVSVGSPGSGTEVIALRLLEAAGLTADDLSTEQLGAGESAGAMKDGLIDAFFWSGGLPTAAVIDLGATPNLNIGFVATDSYLDYLVENYGSFYAIADIPAGTYGESQSENVPVVVVANVLVAPADMDEELAYNITKAIFDNQDSLIAAAPSAAELTLGNAQCSQALPYHAGAVKYLEEQGIAAGTCEVSGGTPEATPEG